MTPKAKYLAKIEGKIEDCEALDEDEAQELIQYIRDLEELCTDSDDYDVHGDGGWRARLEVEI